MLIFKHKMYFMEPAADFISKEVATTGLCLEAGLDEVGHYSCSYHAVYHLLTHLADMSPADIVQYALVSAEYICFI